MQNSSFFAPVAASVRSLRSLFVALPVTVLLCAAPFALPARADVAPATPHIYLFDANVGLLDVTATFDGVSVLDADGRVVFVNITNINSAGGATTDINSAGGATTDINSAGGATTDINSAGGATTDINSAGGATTDIVLDDNSDIVGIVAD